MEATAVLVLFDDNDANIEQLSPQANEEVDEVGCEVGEVEEECCVSLELSFVTCHSLCELSEVKLIDLGTQCVDGWLSDVWQILLEVEAHAGDEAVAIRRDVYALQAELSQER